MTKLTNPLKSAICNRTERFSRMRRQNAPMFVPVNCNNTGTLTADKHAHTCLKPRWRFSRGSASKKWTFRGLGRVSRSGKFSQKFVFERKSTRKSSFLSKVFNFKDSNLVSWIVLSISHPLTAKTSWVTAWYSKYYTSLNVPKKTSHFDSWKNNFKTGLRSGNMFCIKFQVLLKVFSFFPCWNTAI
jgi:hypothetical protein